MRVDRSVLAVDPTPRGLAFTSFESGELLDWGERHSTAKRDELQLLDELVDGLAADVLVVEDPDAPGCRRGQHVRETLRQMIRHAQQRGVGVLPIARPDVRKTWRDRGILTKEAMAAVIAEQFRDLLPFVPPRRRPGHNEDPRANLFDAASLALHVLSLGSRSAADGLRR